MILGSAAIARTALVLAIAGAAAQAHGAPAPAGPFEVEAAAARAELEARRGKPEAVASLAALLALEDDLPPGALEPALQRAAAPGSDPLVAAQATFHLAHLHDEAGDSDGARAARAALGLFTRFAVLGPFGDGRAGFSQAFPPEAEAAAPDSARVYHGKLGDVRWRTSEGLVREGALVLDGMLRPDTQATAYVVAFAQSPRAQDVALRLGTAGPVKVWVNGTLVLARDLVRAAAFDQDAAPARLRAGWNRVVVKTTVTDEPWRLYLRATDPAGHALALGDGGLPAGAKPPPGVSSRPEGAKVAAGDRAGKPARPVRTLEAELRRRATAAAAARPNDESGGAAAAQAWLDLGRYLAWAGPGDRDARDAQAALEAARARRPSVEALRLLADVARDEDERRRALDAALALTGEGTPPPATPDAAASPASAARALVLARLGDTARAQRRDAVALARWREALAADPGCWPAALALADEEQSAGLPLVALARVEALPEATRAVPRVRRQWARLLDAAGRTRAADQLLEGLATARQTDVELLHELATRARNRGDARAFVARLEEAARLRPDLPSLSIDLSRALEGAGEGARAREVLLALAGRLPDDAGVLAHLGKLLHRQGRRDEALARLRVALALRPQDPELRRYLERAERPPGDAEAPGEDLARKHAADARAVIEEAARHPTAEPGDAVVLLDRRVVRVHGNGLAQTFAQRIVAIRTEHGAEENKELDVRYTPGNEDVEIRQARVYRAGAPGGALEVLEAAERDDVDLSEPWYGLYYDNRAEVVRFDGLRAGDVLELQYVIEDVSAENQMADYFGDLQTLAETVPKRLWEYTLIAPKTRPIYSNTPRVPGLARSVAESGNDRVYAFSARDVAAVDAEPAMPGTAEIAPYLHVSTYASWDEVGAWYWRLVEEQLAPDDELRRAARAVVKPKDDDRARVRAIHELVVTGTRYVGLEFGIHGFKPYRVTQVLERRFGDCKDKASLLVAMLREVGVEADLVLLRTRRLGLLDREPASLAPFDHAIAYVPKLDLYIDGTAEFSGTGELPNQDQGVMVLRVGPRGTRYTETPVLPSSENRVERRWRVNLAASGDGRVEEDLRIRGQAAADWREHYQTPGERRERYGRVWEERSPGARLLALEMPGIEDREAPVVVRSSAEVARLGLPAVEGGPGLPAAEGGLALPAVEGSPGLSAAGGRGLTLPVAVREADFARTYARLSTRKQDLVLAYPWQHDEEIVYRLPAGWSLRGGPSKKEVASAFGKLTVEVTSEPGGLVRVHTFLDVTRFRIPAGEYAAFRAFLGDIDSAFAERVSVGPEGGAS
jgi:transglutaminase-like putative cysteine protease/Flp pilus assembly protein TadD